MPRLKDKPLCLNEEAFIDWLEEVYYFKVLDQGLAPEKTPLRLSMASEQSTQEFLQLLRTQMACFELTFPLGKLPALYAKALREISLQPTVPPARQ
jgi:hypothetical protein